MGAGRSQARGLSRGYQTGFVGGDEQVGTVAGVELGEQVTDASLDGLDGDCQGT